MSAAAGRPAPRPKLRCPACGEVVTLPATNCPDCGVDLRTGYLKKKRARRGLRDWAMAGAWALGLAGAAWFLFQNAPWRAAGPPTAARPAAAPAGLTAEGRRAAIEAAPAGFQQLAEDNPLLLLPYIYVYRAKTAVTRYQGQFEGRYDQLKLFDDFQDLQVYRKATPAQRQIMLQEIFDQTRAGAAHD
ncbi:MAG: zinc ribbon domain-containing protein [Candidatus Adiutrix sp.]|jgi:hypothetical protein|nr:zinc ribbon domain-containing protein [Candidatus Adiutrix sp.]